MAAPSWSPPAPPSRSRPPPSGHDRAYLAGGGIDSPLGGTLTVTNSAFVGNATGAEGNGGAIDNGGGLPIPGYTLTVSGSEVLAQLGRLGEAPSPTEWAPPEARTVSDSTFSGNATISTDGFGGAIENGVDGYATLSVSDSMFVGNAVKTRAQGRGGGCFINNGEPGVTKAVLNVSGSTFVANSAHYGGAINEGAGSTTVSGTTFSANSAPYGGAIANGTTATGSLAVSASTFAANHAAGNGGAIDNADGNPGNATVSDSTFWGNSAAGNEHVAGVDSNLINGNGGAIDNADNGGTSTVAVSASTFSGNVAKHSGGTVANDGTLFVVVDIFNGSCYQSSSQTKWSDVGYNVGTNATCLNAGPADVNHGGTAWVPWHEEVGRTQIRCGRSHPTRRSGSSRSTRPSRSTATRPHCARPPTSGAYPARRERPATPERCSRPRRPITRSGSSCSRTAPVLAGMVRLRTNVTCLHGGVRLSP